MNEVTMDIRDLMEYSGQGKCSKVKCHRDTADRYKDQLRTWATSRNWEVTVDEDDLLIIKHQKIVQSWERVRSELFF